MNDIFEDGNDYLQVNEDTADSPAREDKRRIHRNADEKREKRAERLERSSSRRAANGEHRANGNAGYPPVHAVYDNGRISMAAPYDVHQEYGAPAKITPPDMDSYTYNSNPDGYVPYPGERRETIREGYGYYENPANAMPHIEAGYNDYSRNEYEPRNDYSYRDSAYQQANTYPTDSYRDNDNSYKQHNQYSYPADRGYAPLDDGYVRAATRPSYTGQNSSRNRHQSAPYPYREPAPAGYYPQVRAVHTGTYKPNNPYDVTPYTNGMKILYQSPDFYNQQGTQGKPDASAQQIPVIVPRNSSAISQQASSRAPQRNVRQNPSRRTYQPRYEAGRPTVNMDELPRIASDASTDSSIRVTTPSYNGAKNFERDMRRAEKTDFTASGLAVSSVAAPTADMLDDEIKKTKPTVPQRPKTEKQISQALKRDTTAEPFPKPEEIKIGQTDETYKKDNKIIKPAFIFPEDFDDDDIKPVKKKEKKEKKKKPEKVKQPKQKKEDKSPDKEPKNDAAKQNDDNGDKSKDINKEKKDLPASEKARITVLIVSLVVALGSILYLGYQFKLKIDNKKLEQEFSISAEAEQTTKKKSKKKNTEEETEQTTVSDEEYFAFLRSENPDIYYPVGLQAKYAPYYTQNQDFVGYISIDGLGISLPVVQGDDDEEYLKKNFYKQSTKYGCPFVMHLNNIDLMDQNTIIYGHYMRDGSVFAALHDYKSIDGYKKAPVITFNTIYNDYKWKIIAVIITNTYAKDDNDYFFRYYFTNLNTEENFKEYIEALRARSLYSTGTDVLPTDKLLTLSTCSYEFSDARLVVVARMVRPGESATVDTSLASVNGNPKFPQAYYDKKNKKNPYGTDYNWYPDN